jgi:glutathione synthase/RimK-type ligase-like ATP-grasp enzyme
LKSRPFLFHFIDNINFSPKDELGDILDRKSTNNQNSTADAKVLILAGNYDPEADVVCIGLRNKKIEYIRLNMSDIPLNIRIKYDIENNKAEPKISLIIKNKVTRWSNISVIWLRNFNIKEINFGNNELFNLISIQAWENVLPIFLNNLKCNWINNPQSTIQSIDRAKQLTIAKSLGFDIPNTLITNDPEVMLNFYNTHNKNIIAKSVYNHSIEYKGKIYSTFTRKITEHEVFKINDLVYVPYIFQENISRKSELRITVVKDKVFAAKLGTGFILQGHDDEDDDEYHRHHSPKLPIIPIDMPKSFNKKCIKLLELLGLQYGAMDFIIDKDNNIFFLEINPTGDWYGIEKKTKLPITRAVVSLISSFVDI